MVYAILGLPRSGKTTTLACIAYHALQHKSFLNFRSDYKRVFSTFYLKGTYKLDFEDLPNYNFSNSLILVDEIGLLADSRNFKNFSDKMTYFFKMHGHQESDVVVCSQTLDFDKKIRDIIDEYYFLEPWYLGYSLLIPIKHSFDEARGMIDKYSRAPRSKWKHIRRKKYYHLFDSYEIMQLPEPPLVPWEDKKNESLLSDCKARKRACKNKCNRLLPVIFNRSHGSPSSTPTIPKTK